MASLYSNLTAEQIAFLKEYAALNIKQERLTTGTLAVEEDGTRTLTDPNAAFEDNGVIAGDTVDILSTSPVATVPSIGTYNISRVLDNNTIQFSAKVDSLGVNVAYRITDTSPLQVQINGVSEQIASIITVDIAEARYLENINDPWYDTVTAILYNYFTLINALGGGGFAYPVVDSDLDAVTQVIPTPLILAPGPLLYPYEYSGSLPDRRSGAAPGSGTPALLGLPDAAALAVPPLNPPTVTTVPSGARELQLVAAEEYFYVNESQDGSPPPYYSGDEATYLNSFPPEYTTAINAQLAAITALKPLLDEQILDLQTRGITGTSLYATISVARKQLDVAEAEANFSLNDPDEGVAAIDVNQNPDPGSFDRRAFIQTTRPNQINSRLSQISRDIAPWVAQRYSFLDRRVNRSRGSLTLLRRAGARLNDLQNESQALKNQRVAINSILGGLVG